MGKGVIKSTSNSGGSTTGISVTVALTGATGSTTQGVTTPPGQAVTGTLQDAQTGAMINFNQAFGAELGLQVGTKVNYTTVNVGGQVVANSLRLVQRGEITSVNATNDGGTLTDKATGQSIPFAQVFAAESGLAQGVKVNFERVIDPNTGAITAISLETV